MSHGIVIAGPGCHHLPNEGHSADVDRSCPDCDDFVDELLGYGCCEVCREHPEQRMQGFRFRHVGSSVEITCDACLREGTGQ